MRRLKCEKETIILTNEDDGLRLWEILILLYGDCTSTFKVRSTAALAEIFLTGFLPFSDMLCIDKFYFV